MINQTNIVEYGNRADVAKTLLLGQETKQDAYGSRINIYNLISPEEIAEAREAYIEARKAQGQEELNRQRVEGQKRQQKTIIQEAIRDTLKKGEQA